ncbi:3-deoxy-D-manno-octulosonic acid kinase [Vibrio cholerae]
MIQQFQQDNQMIWFDDQLVKTPSALLFDVEYWKEEQKIIGSAKGRGTTWFVSLPHIQAALRHYRRGGLLGKVISDQYLFTGWEQTRCAQELKLLNTLIQAGVNVPRPIAARAVKSGLAYQADLLSERIPNAQDLVSILQAAPLPKQMYCKIGMEIDKMHAAQVNHTDLNIHNILIDDQQKVWLIDFDKCYQQSGEGWKKNNWDRLKRSFKKEISKRAIHFSMDEFDKYFLASK